MMGWLQSNLIVQMQQPWRYTTPPTYNPDGTEATPGVKQTIDGVFILLSDALVDKLALTLTAAQQTELRSFFYRPTMADCALWHIPVWAGDTDGAVFIRVPAAVWNDPATAPPAKVKAFFQYLWLAAT